MGGSLVKALAGTGEAELVAAYDALPQRAQELAAQHGGQAVESAEALLGAPGIEGVIIALPTFLHAEAAMRTAQAGLNVFLEKPMSLTVADCLRVILAARAHRVKLMIGQVLRYYEPYRAILRLQREGRLGQILAASIWRFSDGSKPVEPGSWQADAAKSGGYLWEVGIHELDMLRCLLGNPRSVSAQIINTPNKPHDWEEHISVQMRSAQDRTGLYECGRGAFVGRYGFRLLFEQATLLSEEAFNPQQLRVFGADGQEVSWKDEFSAENPREVELRAWLAACRDEAPVAIPGEEGLANVALAEAARASSITKRAVEYRLPALP
jgi:predicted dehydrogenase